MQTKTYSIVFASPGGGLRKVRVPLPTSAAAAPRVFVQAKQASLNR